MTVISGGLFGFAVPGYVATAGQVAGGMLTAKDIGHLITGKDINGNPLSDADRQAITSSFILDATMVGVSSLSKLKLKYANKVNKMDVIEGVAHSNKFNFGNEKKFDKHFDKHVIKQGEFGNITKDDYLKLANEFIDSSGKNVLSRTASNGDILKFNNKTNEFSIVTKDGVVRTYHKLNPQIHGKGTNLDYWNSPDCNY